MILLKHSILRIRVFRGFLLGVVWASATLGYSQNMVTLSGYVRDAQNGEELIGASVYITNIKVGTITNSYGFYSISVPKGTYDIQYSYMGYKSHLLSITLDGHQSFSPNLALQATLFDEFVVTDKAQNENVVSNQMSMSSVDMNLVRKLPAMLGEVDIIKTIQMMPGVIYAGEGTSAFYVRGGSADQNLVLIDESPIYDPSHLFGLISVFNADIIKDSELYRGGIPARFGGRLSSILDVHTINGNDKTYEVSGGLGLLSSRLAIQGPIIKNKSSVLISARRSYVDALMKAFNAEDDISFYDFNAKLNWKPNNNNRLFAAFYSGRDMLGFEQDSGFDWGNKTGTFRWNHLFNDKLFSNTTFIINSFDYQLEIKDPVQALEWTSRLQELSIKNDLSYFVNSRIESSFGYHLTARKFNPGTIKPTTTNSIFEKVELQKMYALDHALYGSVKQQLGIKLSLDYGVRLSVFQNIGKGEIYTYTNANDNVNITRLDTLFYDFGENIKTYINLEPRISMKYLISEGQSIKVSYNRMVQNTHLISAGTVPVPFNTWSPSGYYLKPQEGNQVAAGYFFNSKNNQFEFSTELYYKLQQHVTDFADNASIFFNADLPTEFRQGKGKAYGWELMVSKSRGKLTGMANYTLSKAQRTIKGVNLDKTFLANFDRRHVFNVQAAYDLNKSWTFGAVFSYCSGRPVTLPSGKFKYANYKPDLITDRNGYRLPAFHRLDLSATFRPKRNETRKWYGEWAFSIYNSYNRKNPFTIYTRTAQDENGNVIGVGTKKELRMVYFFPMIPSVTYNFKF